MCSLLCGVETQRLESIVLNCGFFIDFLKEILLSSPGQVVHFAFPCSKVDTVRCDVFSAREHARFCTGKHTAVQSGQGDTAVQSTQGDTQRHNHGLDSSGSG
jgi:hypothetical protein